MTSKRIRLTGTVTVPPERARAVATALPDHIRLTRAEAGCLSFEVVPDPKDAGRYLVAELFRDRAAFDSHQERTAASNWARVTNGLQRDYRIEEIDP